MLNQRLDPARFSHLREAPSAALAPWIDHFWHVGWDLRGLPDQQQQTLPHPNVHLVVEDGQVRLWGVHRARFNKRLSGHSWAFGIKFRAAAFQPFWGQPVSRLTDRSAPAAEVFGPAAERLAAHAEWPGMATLCAQAQALLLAHLPPPDARAQTLSQLVERIAADPGITSVEQLGEIAGMGVRQLQRLFGQHVGIGPKWIIARYRLHEALALLQSGEARPDAELALRLGYFDQAHFIRDFKRMVGQAPTAYVKTQA
ncbi:MAG TPA: helix-turn-helix transcriptional regulator [Ideonella sp.]|uniref:helix-turn-helix transcriptional regulator n=1 Tax=Ideonella sp. TaxID=1929293 RepID=UPI002C0C9872|nr:helix-turn-helix transcriptional regulator [Ideonella sp.]HSI46968.1 helix-turn-helix transcriptional regulator [Ideonella sp.]